MIHIEQLTIIITERRGGKHVNSRIIKFAFRYTNKVYPYGYASGYIAIPINNRQTSNTMCSKHTNNCTNINNITHSTNYEHNYHMLLQFS